MVKGRTGCTRIGGTIAGSTFHISSLHCRVKEGSVLDPSSTLRKIGEGRVDQLSHFQQSASNETGSRFVLCISIDMRNANTGYYAKLNSMISLFKLKR